MNGDKEAVYVDIDDLYEGAKIDAGVERSIPMSTLAVRTRKAPRIGRFRHRLQRLTRLFLSTTSWSFCGCGYGIQTAPLSGMGLARIGSRRGEPEHKNWAVSCSNSFHRELQLAGCRDTHRGSELQVALNCF